MAKKSTTKPQKSQPTYSPLLRIAGRELAAAAQLAQATATLPPQTVARPAGNPNGSDYAQIDLDLALTPSPILQISPDAGVGYAGFTPQQRHHFLAWTLEPDAPAPLAFRQLYLANLEVNLFDDAAKAHGAKQTLVELTQMSAWQGDLALARSMLLAFWITQDRGGLSRWLATGGVPLSLTGLALGHLALLHEPLNVDQVLRLAQQWQMSQTPPTPILMQLRLASLTATLGSEPLQQLLAGLEPAMLHPKPWRCTHRDLRLALPQPDLRAALEPLLQELLDAPAPMIPAPLPAVPAVPQGSAEGEEGDDEEYPDDGMPTRGEWHLILEFGESRSDLFEFALQRAQKLPGYVQMLDENRRMVHRVHFRKSEVRRFWQLWDYVQSWSGTGVYLNGKELEKWQVYPYSPAMR